MSDLLAKCDWREDELRIELPQWPEVVTVWVNGKAMPYVPVVNDSKCDTCEAMLDCDECTRADAVDALLRERADTIAEYAKRLRLAGDAE